MKPEFEKLLYTLACVVALVLSIASVADVAVHGRNEAALALRTTTAVCSLRDYYAGQVRQSQAFLNLSPAQRVAKYGAIGDVPDAEIRAGLVKYRLVVSALSDLRCPSR